MEASVGVKSKNVIEIRPIMIVLIPRVLSHIFRRDAMLNILIQSRIFQASQPHCTLHFINEPTLSSGNHGNTLLCFDLDLVLDTAERICCFCQLGKLDTIARIFSFYRSNSHGRKRPCNLFERKNLLNPT